MKKCPAQPLPSDHLLNDAAIARALSDSKVSDDDIPGSLKTDYTETDALIAQLIYSDFNKTPSHNFDRFIDAILQDEKRDPINDIYDWNSSLSAIIEPWKKMADDQAKTGYISDVHLISHNAGQLFNLALSICGQPSICYELESVAQEAIEHMERLNPNQPISSMPTLKDYVFERQMVREGSQLMGRMDQLLGLIYLLGGKSDAIANSLVTVLESNVQMGGGCPQGIFNRFVLNNLYPNISNLLRDLTDRLSHSLCS